MTSHSIAGSIASWKPARHGLDTNVAELLAAEARRIVSEGDFDSPSAAKLACGHVFRYLDWRRHQAAPGNDLSMVDQYVSHLQAQGAPPGTIHPVRAALHRCIASTRISPTASTPRTATEAIATYAPDPRRVAPELWAQIADTARTVVTLTAPSTPRQATSRLAPTSLYLAWSRVVDEDRQQFSPESLERFLAVGRTAWGESTFRTYQSDLRNVARAARPELWPQPRKRTTAASPLYDMDGLERIARSVRGRTSTPRRHVGGLVLLGRGAGVVGAAAAAVRPEDVERHGGDVAVGVTRRGTRHVLPVIDPCAEPLMDLASRGKAAGDQYLLGGRGDRGEGSAANRVSELTRTHAELTAVTIEPTRLRNCWLAELVARPLDLRTVLELAGLHSATSLDAILRAGTVEDDPARLFQIARLL